VGFNALYYDTVGAGNTGVGNNALINTNGNYNTAVGYNAGIAQTTGYNNILLGANVNYPNTAGNYQLNIGNVIYGTGVDSTTINKGKVGINTPAPNSTLHVNGSFAAHISNLAAGSYTVQDSDYYMIIPLGAAVTITMPQASACPGRMLYVQCTDPTASGRSTAPGVATINTSGAAGEAFSVIGGYQSYINITLTGGIATSIKTIGTAYIKFISNGTYWYITQ
jgi:hypothetical protein